MSVLRLLVFILLLFGPIVVFLFVQHRLSTIGLRLMLALAFALTSGAGAWAAASTIGLAVQARGARVDVPVAAAGPVFFGFTMVMLTIFTFRPPDAMRAARESLQFKPAEAAVFQRPDVSPAPGRPHRRLFWILISIYALALLAWPLMSFGAVFAFDDPNANRALAWYIAASIWLYPAYVIAGFVLGYYNRNPSVIVLALKTSVPLLSAIWFFLIPGIPALAITWLKSPSVEEAIQERADLEARLDPIYAQRSVAVRARDAEADVLEAVRLGDVALIPYTPGQSDYVGIEGPPPMEGAAAQAVIDRSAFLTGIVGLLYEDSTHPRSRMGDRETYDYSSYYSDTFKDFLTARREYMVRFNTAMVPHLK